MDNPNPSTSLVDFKWNFVKHIKFSDLYSTFHNGTITSIFFEILQMHPEMCVTYRIKCFPPFWYDKSNPSISLGNVLWKIDKH